MGEKYKHFNYEDRKRIKQLLDKGFTVSDIAEKMGLNSRSVYREINRGKNKDAYDPDYAELNYQEKLKKKGPQKKVEMYPVLADFISKSILIDKNSPEKIEALVKNDQRFSDIHITKQSIYYAIYTGSIPGVTKETLTKRKNTVTMHNDGQIGIPKWIRDTCGFSDKDVFIIEIEDENTIILKKPQAKA